MKSRIVVIFLLTIMLITCVLYNLERRLGPDIKDWYGKHWMIMEYPVPKNIHPTQCSEQLYFLYLSPTLQRKYIEKFWEIREIGMEEEYGARLNFTMKSLLLRGEGIDPWLTDRARIILLCGFPFEELFKDENGDPYMEGEEQWSYERQAGKRHFRHWLYWYGSGFFQQIVEVVFEWDGLNRWRYLEKPDSIYQEFITYWKWRMAPTPEGWELWRTIYNE